MVREDLVSGHCCTQEDYVCKVGCLEGLGMQYESGLYCRTPIVAALYDVQT
jgi:hypothetical protein